MDGRNQSRTKEKEPRKSNNNDEQRRAEIQKSHSETRTIFTRQKKKIRFDRWKRSAFCFSRVLSSAEFGRRPESRTENAKQIDNWSINSRPRSRKQRSSDFGRFVPEKVECLRWKQKRHGEFAFFAFAASRLALTQLKSMDFFLVNRFFEML